MHWFQSLDTALFHFINGTLANPFFDWLMPVLSGNGVPWLPAVIVGVLWILVRGSTRLRLCALFAVLVVALGDPLVVGTIKHTVNRPRPFVTLPDARLFGQTGKGYVAPMANGELPASANRNSMPSAHSANWFAIAMTVFFFYRRSAWILFPLAASVAFSRVYNGVHYPGDVLAGGILGAGYAIAFAFAAEAAWNVIGRKWFPQWHAQLPNLLNPGPTGRNPEFSKSAIGNRQSAIEWLRLAYIVIVLALIGRWLYLGSGLIGLSQDEAYQWLWSKHLALSYYSKPPGIAFIQWAGTALGGDTELGVRFFSPVLAAILSVLVVRFLAREVGGRAAFCLLMLTFATPLFVAGSLLITVDPPLVLCWMWAVIAGWRAAQADGRTRDWLVVGLALGLGFLSKYTAMLQLVCWAIFFWLQPAARVHLRKRGPWLALGVFALGTLPVLIWNSRHHWISATHVAGNAGLDKPWQPTLRYFWEFTGAEFGLLNPIFFVGAIWAMVAAWKRRRERPLWLFLFCMSAPVFFGHWLYSLHSRVEPNWIAAAVTPMFCLMVAYWSESKVRVQPWLIAGLGLGLFTSVMMLDLGLLGKITGSKLPGDADPSHRLNGWRETAQFVESERGTFDPKAFLIGDHYGTTGLCTFYSPAARAAAQSGTPLVYSIFTGQPENQFFFWDEYNYEEHRRGQNAIYVVRLNPYPLEKGWFWKWLRNEPVQYREIPPARPAPGLIAGQFESVTNLGIHEIHLRDGRIFQRVQLFGCYHLK